MGAWKNAFLLQEKPMSVKFLLLGGGFFGGECRFYFYGREDFSEILIRYHNSKLRYGKGSEDWLFFLGKVAPNQY